MAVVLPDAPGVIRIEHRGTVNGTPYANIFHVSGSVGGYDQSIMDAVATAMHNAYFNAFIPLLNANTILSTTTSIDLTTRQGFTGLATTSHTGTATGTTATPNSLAVCLSWEIRDRYRGGHPRMYLPARSAGDVLQGKSMSTTVRDLYDAAASGYLTSVTSMTAGGQTWSPLCVRYWSHHQLLQDPLQRKIVDVKVGTRFDSQRRRMGRETGI